MTHRMHQLLALLPEHEHQSLLGRLPGEVVAAIAQECELEDEAVLEMLAEAVWNCLEE